MARDYKDEYQKFQKDKSSYRAKLNKYNRKKGTYGNGDGRDASHDKGGKIKGFVESSKNKGKREKSRLRGSKRKKYNKGGKMKGPSHSKGGININVEGGEYVIKKESAKKIGYDKLDKINEHGRIPTFDARERSKR